MIPWQRQQFWFWIAAIFVVAGAAALRDTPQLAVDSSNVQQHKPVTNQVYRSRQDLPPPTQARLSASVPATEKNSTPSTTDASPGGELVGRQAAFDPLRAPSRDDSAPASSDQFVMEHSLSKSTFAGFSERDDFRLRETNTVQPVSFTATENQQLSRPVVWLVGSIEPDEE